MHDITELNSLLDTKTNLLKSIQDSKELLAKVILEISEKCTCPTVVRKSSYSPGGYDHTSTSRVWYECTICGREHDEKITRGGYG